MVIERYQNIVIPEAGLLGRITLFLCIQTHTYKKGRTIGAHKDAYYLPTSMQYHTALDSPSSLILKLETGSMEITIHHNTI